MLLITQCVSRESIDWLTTGYDKQELQSLMQLISLANSVPSNVKRYIYI